MEHDQILKLLLPPDDEDVAIQVSNSSPGSDSEYEGTIILVAHFLSPPDSE